MQPHRSPRKAAAAAAWNAFTAANGARFEFARVPAAALRSVSSWDELLRRGRFVPGPGEASFDIGALADEEYAVLVDLVESYFLAGYEYFTPRALRAEDQSRLASRFVGDEGPT